MLAMPRLSPRVFSCLALAAGGLALTLAGCRGTESPAGGPLDVSEPITFAGVGAEADDYRLTLGGRQIPMFDGTTAEPVTARSLQQRLEAADVVLLGELHGDDVGHRVQARLVAAALPSDDGGAVAFEALERKRPVTPYLGSAQQIEADLGKWPDDGEAYRRIIRYARANDIPIYAANAPRERAALARVEGVRALPNDGLAVRPTITHRKKLVDYRGRFGEVFAQLDKTVDVTTTRPATGPAKKSSTRPTTRTGRSVDDFFDGQLVWDATMAQSVFAAHAVSDGPVFLLVGGFHTDFDGGVTTLVRDYGLDVLTVSLLPVESGRLRPDDVGRANVVIYTGPLVPRDPMSVTRPASRPTTAPTPATRPTTQSL